MEEIISRLKTKQEQLSHKYKELEELQGEYPQAYGIIQDDMQRIDDMNEHYRRAIYNIEAAKQLECEAV